MAAEMRRDRRTGEPHRPAQAPPPPAVASVNGNGGPEDWKARARRAEAQASASNVLKISTTMRAVARERELQAQITSIRGLASWRLTAPLRWLARFARARRRHG
jgi:hypothetical protein